MELANSLNPHELKEKIIALKELVDSYLLKDILALEKIKKPETLFNLVKPLSFQIVQLVSHRELTTQLHIDTKTVTRYIDLLEKSFVIYKLGTYSTKLRNEIQFEAEIFKNNY